MSVIIFLSLTVCALMVEGKGPCYYDGTTYAEGDTIMIPHCLATMKCLGDNNYGDMVQLGGVCPDKRETDGQNGCWFDGTVYGKGQKIIIQPCLAEMTCDGNNNYINTKSLHGVCPDDQNRREVDGQTGCLFDGKVYAAGETIVIQKCLAEFTCLGHNTYSQFTSLGGQC